MSLRTMIENFFLKGNDYYVSMFLVAVAHFYSLIKHKYPIIQVNMSVNGCGL